MTGFGNAARENAMHRIAVRARSVNHRGLDVVIRLPDPHRDLESRVRGLVAERLARGRVELTIEIDRLQPLASRVKVDSSLVHEIVGVVEELQGASTPIGALTAGDLLRMPGVVEVERERAAFSDADNTLLGSG